jgi:hypothetical protein
MDNKKIVEIPRYFKAFICKDSEGNDLDFKIPYYCEIAEIGITPWDFEVSEYAEAYKIIRPILPIDSKHSFIDELVSKKIIKSDANFFVDATFGKHKIKQLTKEDESELEVILKENKLNK